MLKTQEEREALVNLMLLMRFSDKTLSLAELDTFEKIMHSMDWRDVISEDSFVSEASKSVRYALQSESLTDSFINKNCGVFSDESKLLVVDKLSSVMLSDGEHDSERMILDKVKKKLSF